MNTSSWTQKDAASGIKPVTLQGQDGALVGGAEQATALCYAIADGEMSVR
jgi:hypothetical protein